MQCVVQHRGEAVAGDDDAALGEFAGGFYPLGVELAHFDVSGVIAGWIGFGAAEDVAFSRPCLGVLWELEFVQLGGR